MQPEPHPNAGKNRRYKFGIFLVLLAMISLAAWAWWIPNRVFDPWVETVNGWLRRFQR